jgi:hypothetical protein
VRDKSQFACAQWWDKLSRSTKSHRRVINAGPAGCNCAKVAAGFAMSIAGPFRGNRHRFANFTPEEGR